MDTHAKSSLLLASFILALWANWGCTSERVVHIHNGKPVQLTTSQPVVPAKMLPVDITIILDRSGSMGKLTEQVIVSYNDFLQEQKTVDGEAFVSLIQFDDKYEPNYAGVEIRKAEELTTNTYEPRGLTALFDAIGRAITEAKARISLGSADVVFVITTDGLENASIEFSGEQIKEMIAACESDLGWHFMYLAANQDAFMQHKEMGISALMCLEVTDTPEGWKNSQAILSRKLTEFRGDRKIESLVFSDADRK